MNDDVLLSEFAGFQRGKALSEKTIENREVTMRAFARVRGVQLLSANTRDLRGYLGRGITPASMQTERYIFRAFYGFLVFDELRVDDPTIKLVAVKVPRAKPRPYTQEQVTALLDTGAYWRTRVMILLGVLQGFRAGDVARAHADHFDLVANRVKVDGKGGVVEYLPLHPVIAAIVPLMGPGYWFPARAGRHGHVHSDSVSTLMTRAKKRAGIKDRHLTGHSLRHAYATDLLATGVDVRIVQELLRHASLASTQIYTKVFEEQKQAAVLQLPRREIPKHSGRRLAA